MKKSWLLPLLVCTGCLDFGYETPGLCPQSGQKGEYWFGYSDGALVFPHCDALTDRVLAPDGATAWITVSPAHKNPKPWRYARSTDNLVVVAGALQSGQVSVSSVHPGRAFVELYDDSNQLADRAEVVVQRPTSIDLPGMAGASPVVLLAGSPLWIEHRPQAATPYVGVGAGVAEAGPPLEILQTPGLSLLPLQLFDNPNNAPTFTELVGSPGNSTFTIGLDGVTTSVAIQVVDVSALTSAKADPPSLTISLVSSPPIIHISALSNTTVVRGARCQWTVPAGLQVPLEVESERLGSDPGTAYQINAVTPGSFTARCWLPGSLTVDVPITVLAN